MTCGIYRLIFRGTDSVYIGQSKNIENRYLNHISSFTRRDAAVKLMNAVDTYGIPTYDILVICEESELDVNEDESIDIWNSYLAGFNSRTNATGGGRGSYGELNGRSKYNDYTIIQAFKLICAGEPAESISSKTEIAIGTIYSISRGANHTWLKHTFPTEYASMLGKVGSKSKSAATRGIVYPDIISPEGITYSVDNIRQFAITHSLDRGSLNKVLNKKARSTKGWKLA